MATIHELCKREELIALKVRLQRFQFETRSFYASLECKEWLDQNLSLLVAIDKSNIAPRSQFVMLLQDFITGKSFDYPRDFRRLRPVGEDVYELKTPDLRVFGWFHIRDTFIAVKACGIEEVKAHSLNNLKVDLYKPYIDYVIEYRNNLDLDHPKLMQGAEWNDVISI